MLTKLFREGPPTMRRRALRIPSGRRHLAVLAAGVLLAGACNRDGGGGQASSSTTPQRGRLLLYAMAGERPEHSDLAAIYTAPFHLERLTQGARVSSVATCRNKVLAAAPSPTTDRIQSWDGKAFTPVPALADLDRSGTPTLTPDCMLAFISAEASNSGRSFSFTIKAWRDGDSEPRTIFESPNPLSPSSWGPNGSLAVIDLTSKELVVVKADGTVVRTPSPWPDAQSVEWSSTGRLAMTDWKTTRVFAVDSGSVTTSSEIDLGEWVAITWSTEGDELLVHRGTKLATASGARLETITELGDTGVPVYDAGWAPEGGSWPS